MGKPSGTDRKVHALREQGTLNPHPKRIRDEEFLQEAFFDARDLVQVKYEMLRRVKVEGSSISQAARSFGFSRPAFYQARSVFDARGLPGLIPKRRGPKGGHKLNEGVMTFVEGLLNQNPALGTDELSQRLKEEYGIQVHPRTVERALKAAKKKRASQEEDRLAVSSGDLVSHYEALRGMALRGERCGCGALGRGVLVRSGMADWMRSLPRMNSPLQQREHKREDRSLHGMLPPDKAELVKVLACMVLHHAKEEVDGHAERS